MGKYTRLWQPAAEDAPPPGLRRAPVRAPSVEADVSVPFKQAVITGGMILATAAVVGPLVLLGAIGPAIGICVLFLIVLGIWCILIFWMQPKTLWQEFGDKKPKKEGTQVIKVFVDLSGHNGGQRYQQASLQPPRKSGPAGLLTFLRSLTLAGSFSEREASGCGFTRAEWEALRDEFLTLGWAKWKDETSRQQGLQLTADGEAVVGELAAKGMRGE